MIRCHFCTEESNCPYYPLYGEPPPCFEKGEKFQPAIRKGIQYYSPRLLAFAIRCAICILLILIATFGLHWVSVLSAILTALLWPIPGKLEHKKNPAGAVTPNGAHD